MRIRKTSVLCSLALVASCSSAPELPVDTAAQCENLAGAQLPETQLTGAMLITDRQGLPDFCKVRGEIVSAVGFEMRLPVDDWNGKFVVTGCGGFCGSLRPDKPGFSNSMNEALKSGYAVIQTDGGHKAQSWETDWAIGNESALDLFAGQWMPLAVTTGQGLIDTYYADEPSRTYFTGCSNGGRLGMYAAQRHPELFDGIAAGGAIFDLTGNSGVHGLWLLQSTRDQAGKAVIDRAKLPMVSAHVLEQCDAVDGVEDGTVSRTSLCEPDLSALQCEGDARQNCLTGSELVAIERLYQGATVEGKQLFAGLPPGSESRWSQWVVGTDEKRAWGEAAAEGNLRLTYDIPADQAFNPHDYVLADELENLQRYAAKLNAVNPDLSGLTSAGTKLFYYHGMADPLILQGRVREYYSDAVAITGREQLDEVARFMMVPGHGHCWALPSSAADDFDPLAVVDRWVESGEAPDEVIAKSYTSELTRKLCPYPQFAKLVGDDPNSAESYVCH